MGEGGWLNLRLSNQPGRECSPLLSLMTGIPAPFLKENKLVLHEGFLILLTGLKAVQCP